MNRLVSDRWQPLAALILLGVTWGYNWVVMKKSLLYMGPFDFNAFRMALGGMVLLFFMRCQGMSVRPKAVPLTVLLGLTQTAAGTGLILLALVNGGAGKTSILVYTMPFWILIFAWPVLSEKIRGLNWIPVVTAFAGMVLLLEPWSLKSTLASEILAVIAGMFWAFGAIIIKVMQKKPDFDFVSVTAWQIIYGSVPLVMAALLIPQPPVQWTPYLIMALFYNTFLVCAFAFLLWTFIMKRLPAGVAGMGTLAVPVIGISASLIELGERPDTWETLGMMLILAALSLLTALRFRDNRRNAKASVSESIHDSIPSREECNEIMAKYSMRPNIIEHSIQVMRVSLAITDNLKNDATINRDLVIAAALLHDITKTRSLETKERHDASGGVLLREMGFMRIAEIVEQHVIFKNFNPQGRPEEREIIYYADKRVMHDKIVTIEQRIHDLIQRYGTTGEIRNLILNNTSLALAIERKIASHMKVDIHQAIQKIAVS